MRYTNGVGRSVFWGEMGISCVRKCEARWGNCQSGGLERGEGGNTPRMFLCLCDADNNSFPRFCSIKMMNCFSPPPPPPSSPSFSADCRAICYTGEAMMGEAWKQKLVASSSFLATWRPTILSNQERKAYLHTRTSPDIIGPFS